MATADEQIRIGDSVKRDSIGGSDRESSNDVLEGLFSVERDLLARFGRWSEETAKRAREARERHTQWSNERMKRLTEES